MKNRLVSFALCLFLSASLLPGTALAALSETAIILSDNGVSVDGSEASEDPSDAVYIGADIVYYETGHDSSYGEGTSADEHTQEEADAHTVVTITQPGTYRVSGTLSAGQLAVDLGSDASDDPDAVVTLILDGADITCTVAPAVIFYNVYECCSAEEETASAIVDTSAAGANVILADGSVNQINGSYVAKIYMEGTTKKLHKYDGAFYSRMSMNISGETLGTGCLNIVAGNEGLDSELHLSINGGIISIKSQDDGINTNEDNISVTTINAGTLSINAGLGVEGDGIDSNGYLVINGGTIITMANEKSPDGGIDADKDILLNGGTVIALGTRNDAVSASSGQAYMELSFAATTLAGSIIRITDKDGNVLLTHTAEKNFQSLTFSSGELTEDTVYYVYINNIQQQYTGNASGMMGGGMGPGGTMPGNSSGETPQTPPDGETMPEQSEGDTPPEMPEGTTLPGEVDSANNSMNTGEGSVEFTLSASIHSFSGVSDSAEASGKTNVTFSVNSGNGISNVSSGKTVAIESVSYSAKDGSAVELSASDVQLTVVDMPSESYAESCLLSEGMDAVAAILPTTDGTYRLTVSILSSNATYAGTSQWQFTIGALPFNDVKKGEYLYDAVKFVYDAGLMVGTGTSTFSPNQAVSRAMAITVLGRLANAGTAEESGFSDVISGSWYASYVGWASANEIVKGYENGLYYPNNSVSRQEMCVIIARYAKTAGLTLGTSGDGFSDTDSVADWAADSVSVCQAAGLLDGIVTDSRLHPTQELTRGELADLLMRLSKLS